MLRLSSSLVAALLVACSVGDASKSRPLRGRFLHITDFHPDPHFKTYSSTEENAACHRKHGPAGYYGAETSGCDSPVSLVNATMDWIKHNIADDVDFVIWTGDSARHDNDEKLPRTQKEIISQNELMVEKLTDVFGSGREEGDPTKAFKIPIVPTFGNNDIMPHNIFLPGPNQWTVRYTDIWKGFIPEAQRHQFQQGGWFSVEVIPGRLAVVSLNTMYFFTSNSGVDGCAKKKEPGYEQFEWLRVQLQIMRDRGISAILIGHVPPARVDSKESWDETCWQKYALWARQYRDVIVGSLYGHMNIDHFMLQDFHHIKKGATKGLMAASNITTGSGDQEDGFLTDGEVSVASASEYLVDLRWWWSKIPSPPSKKNGKRQSIAEYVDGEDDEEPPTLWQKALFPFSKPDKKPKDGKKKSFLDKIGGPYAERYSVSMVAPSVVPNYFPTIRVIEYNITGLEHVTASPVSDQETSSSSLIQDLAIDHELPDSVTSPDDTNHDFSDDETYLRNIRSILMRKRKYREKESLKKLRKHKFRVPDGPSKSSPPGPAYSPQTLTFTSYTQYFANLTHINNDFVSEALPQTHSLNENSPQTIFGLKVSEGGQIEQKGWKEGKHGKHQGKKPHLKPHPKRFKFEVEYDTKTDERYGLEDLTVRSLMDLARRIGEGDEGSKPTMSTEDDGEEDEQENDDAEEDVESNKNKERKKKKHGKHKHSKNKTWLTFVERAFVGTLDPRELELFNSPLPSTEDIVADESEEEENMEL